MSSEEEYGFAQIIRSVDGSITDEVKLLFEALNKENQRIKVLEKSIYGIYSEEKLLIKADERLAEEINQIENSKERLRRHRTQLHNANPVMVKHKEALVKQYNDEKEKSRKQRERFSSIIEKYETKWNTYFKAYEERPLAKEFRTLNEIKENSKLKLEMTNEDITQLKTKHKDDSNVDSDNFRNEQEVIIRIAELWVDSKITEERKIQLLKEVDLERIYRHQNPKQTKGTEIAVTQKPDVGNGNDQLESDKGEAHKQMMAVDQDSEVVDYGVKAKLTKMSPREETSNAVKIDELWKHRSTMPRFARFGDETTTKDEGFISGMMDELNLRQDERMDYDDRMIPVKKASPNQLKGYIGAESKTTVGRPEVNKLTVENYKRSNDAFHLVRFEDPTKAKQSADVQNIRPSKSASQDARLHPHFKFKNRISEYSIDATKPATATDSETGPTRAKGLKSPSSQEYSEGDVTSSNSRLETSEYFSPKYSTLRPIVSSEYPKTPKSSSPSFITDFSSSPTREAQTKPSFPSTPIFRKPTLRSPVVYKSPEVTVDPNAYFNESDVDNPTNAKPMITIKVPFQTKVSSSATTPTNAVNTVGRTYISVPKTPDIVRSSRLLLKSLESPNERSNPNDEVIVVPTSETFCQQAKRQLHFQHSVNEDVTVVTSCESNKRKRPNESRFFVSKNKSKVNENDRAQEHPVAEFGFARQDGRGYLQQSPVKSSPASFTMSPADDKSPISLFDPNGDHQTPNTDGGDFPFTFNSPSTPSTSWNLF